MTIDEQYRVCPKCQTRRPQNELFCEALAGDNLCGWDLSSVDITNGTEKSSPPPHQNRTRVCACPNGPPLDQGDWFCAVCGTEIFEVAPPPIPPSNPASTEAEPLPAIEGWQTQHQLSTSGTARRRYIVRRESDGLDAVLTIYNPGAQPDSTVYDALRTRLSKEHIAELIEHGRVDGQAYDVTEHVQGGNLTDLRVSASDTSAIRQIVEEMSSALAAFLEVGLRHRALQPQKVLIRSREPLDLVVTGFESSRLSEADLEIESLLDVSRYTAPEAVMGAVASASDWWSLGMMLLGLITSDQCFQGANDQLFLIHVQGNGAPIPPGLDSRIDLLLRGLLSKDRTARWQWKEVREWLAGESPPVPQVRDSQSARNEGPAIFLSGVSFHDPRRFAIEASRATNWAEACDLLAHGRIGLWLDELKCDARIIANVRQLGRRIEPAVGFRLGIVLQLLNPQLPFIYSEEIVNPDWLLHNPVLGYELISSSVPELLPEYGIESDDWLRRLSRRATSVRERARDLEIELDELRWQVLVLSASNPRLAAQWEQRRKELPDANHPGLASLIERSSHRDEDLILLLAASVAQFRSRDELVADTVELAERHHLPVPSEESMHEWLDHSRRDLFSAIDQRIAGFARCGHERIDIWADHFRLERRLSLAESMLLLAFPVERWAKPRHQDYVASVLGFFEKRVSSAGRRGPLMRMTIGKTTPRADFIELATDPRAATALLSNLIQRSGKTFSVDPLAFADENGPEVRMRSLLNKTTQYLRDTGINGSYIGFPFLLVPATNEQTRPRLAPVLLWPVKLAGEVGNRGQFSLTFDSDRGGVRVNPGFEGLYGLEGAGRWRAVSDELLSRSSCTVTDVIDAFGTLATPAQRTLVRLPKIEANNQPTEERITCCAVLFHLQFLGQSLVEDLRQLKQRPLDGTALETMLRIEGALATSNEADSPSGRFSQIEPDDDVQPVLVTRSDPSQEEAITKMYGGAGLVVQGPPGTGKSQTIVNLVADSIAKRRSLLIVCQKLPALEVVRKRLAAEQLENRIVMVTNVTSDRTPLISEIRSQLERLQQEDSRQVELRLREIRQVEAQIRQLETEIDAHHVANHKVDSICQRSYRQILGELIQFDDATTSELPDVFALRNLFQGKSWQDITGCEEACGSVAEEWLAATYEGNPLETTQPNSHDAATAQEFHRILAGFREIEEDRVRIPPPSSSVGGHDCPEGLEEWLFQYRSTLQRWTDRELEHCAALAPLFRQTRIGADYSQTLQRLLELETGRARPPITSSTLLQWAGTITAAQADAISASCELHANVWWSAKAENSPLVVIRIVLDPESCEIFRKGYEHFIAVEQIRWNSACSVDTRIELQDPKSLEKWLADFQEPITEIVATAGDLLSRLLPLPNQVELSERYAVLLKDRLKFLQNSRTFDIFLAPVSELLVRCEERQIERIAGECGAVADLWVDDSVDLQRLDGITAFPKDQAECVEMQVAIAQFVKSEKTRDTRLANLPNSSQLIESNVFRSWLKENIALIDRADETLFKDATNWQPFFRSERGRVAKAEEFRKQLKELRQQIHCMTEDSTAPDLEQAVSKLDSQTFAEVIHWVRKICDAKASWFNWSRFSSKRRLKSWLHSQRITWNEDRPQQMDVALRRETERRRIQIEVENILRGLSLNLNTSNWIDVVELVQKLPERLIAAFRVCKAVLAYPITLDKRVPLNGWNRESLTESIKSHHVWLEIEEATLASRSALESLRPTMTTAWIDWQQRLITGGRLSAIHRGYLEGLAEEVQKLTYLTAFRSRLAGCDPLTPRILAALSPIRETLASLAPQHLAKEIENQIRHHWVAAREQLVESEAPQLRDLHSEHAGEILSLYEKLSRVRWLFGAMKACPEPSKLRAALLRGSLPAIQDLFQRFHLGLEQEKSRQASLAALSKLRDQFDSSWCEACEKAIERNESNEVRLKPLLDSLAGLLDYMDFRAIETQLSPEAHQAFAILALERETLATIPDHERASEIAHAIRWAFWRRKQSSIEESAPVLRRLRAISTDSYVSALNWLDSTQRLVQIVDACPNRQALVPAIQSGAAREVESVLKEFECQILRRQALKRSQGALESLLGWMKPEWIQETRRKLDAGESIANELSRLLSAVPTFSAYQLFRLRIATLTTLHFQVFAAIERLRPILMEAAKNLNGALSLMVRQFIRREGLLAWKRQLERQYPDVLVNGNSLTNKLKSLQELDDRLRELNRERLGGDLPIESIAPIGEWEDITRLRGPRSRSLRQFFHLGRERGLLTLRPVWMMTPDVASQLLPLEKAVFDLVIFDEASQMPVEYAISSLFRARAVLVSGDDKQMPPSTFFSGHLESDETEWTDEEPVDDSASEQERSIQEQAWNRREVKDCPDLLHLGLAALPKTTLQIHYRSEYRELISYSNAAFYRNELGVPVRHPDETVRKKQPIEYIGVNGIYGDQQNPDEAQRVVEFLAELWSTSKRTVPSVGVVTFNLRQADLIEEKLEERAVVDEVFRAAYRRELDRRDAGEDMSFFVKNVENVQGDERDYIIFSTTFGRTKAGAFRRNFGALGQSGGERRLNVAVTRARRKVIIIGSMPIEEISDMLRTRRRPEVPRDYLQAYLHYASLVSSGHLQESRALVERISAPGQTADAKHGPLDGFKESVARFIRELGYEPILTGNDPVLGVDFSIRNPKTGLYGIGIECDPPEHRLLRRARSREIWRRSILSRVYPALQQVSAYAWYHEPEIERERLRQSIHQAVSRR